MGARVVLSLDDAIIAEVELTKPMTVVGRHPACDIVIDSPLVSGRHMLFWVVDLTVYAEDLASTNGMRVNGLGTSYQVVNHLDLIEIGRHKLRFFDDERLAGGVGNLKGAVPTDYERTPMAARVVPAHAATRRGDASLSRTQAIPRDPSLRLGQAQESVRTYADAAPAVLALRVLAGGRRGEVISLKNPNTMIGAAGVDMALITRRGQSFFLARLSGSGAPRLNRKELESGTRAIGPQDRIDVGGWSYEVIREAGQAED